MKKKNTIPSGFEDILGNIYSNAEEGGGVTNIDEMNQLETPLVDENIIEEPPVQNPEDGKTADLNGDPNAKEDTTPEPPAQVINPEPPVNEPPVEEPPTDEDPTEADVIEA